MAKSSIKKFLEAGVHFTEMSREKAEAIVKDLVKSGEVRAKDGEKLIQTLVERGREASERIAAGVQSEVTKQMASTQARFEELESKLEALIGSIRGTDQSSAARPATPAASAPATTTTPATTVASKKAAAKKAPAKKKAAAKKAAVKKTAGKKAATKKSAAKQAASGAVGSSGVRQIRTTRSG
jgi:polyhydroxyalkanoate synthesis regulator phasin